ncbi:hypothetical protein HYU18_00530 [Candidatus Woesearchaeota archaeon]|nr:hypothetical protein [Candidatus Woesearchaeota archaeon]
MKLVESKTAIIRTLEALMAIFITFIFLIIFIPQQREQAFPAAPPSVLGNLGGNDVFRNCVLMQNYTCINQTIDSHLEDKYDFKANVSESRVSALPQLPQKRIYANAIMIAGNTTNSTRQIVRLYYWAKD